MQLTLALLYTQGDDVESIQRKSGNLILQSRGRGFDLNFAGLAGE